MRFAWHSWLLLLNPRRVERRLEAVRRAELIERVPNLWQIELGVLRMWHRLVFRPETIGMCSDAPVRRTWRARLLEWRPLRFVPLLLERAIAPWDMSGLLSGVERVMRHLLGAHHEADQFVYDLEMLSVVPGALSELQGRVEAVLDGSDPRGRWLEDLVVYERYHEALLEAIERFLRGVGGPRSDDPDISFVAYLRWCARQPPTPAATHAAWSRGAFTFASGVEAQ